MEGDREPRPFVDTEYNEGGAVFSPDGNWLAYVSDESGREEVYVRAFPGPGGKMQISSDGGNEPVWAGNNRELFYRNQDLMMAVTITSEEPFRASRPQPLFEASYDDAGVASRGYDITPDGQSFIVVRSERVSVATQVHVILNWFEELKRRAPVR
jgi:serine/threonine-protein kinase